MQCRKSHRMSAGAGRVMRIESPIPKKLRRVDFSFPEEAIQIFKQLRVTGDREEYRRLRNALYLALPQLPPYDFPPVQPPGAFNPHEPGSVADQQFRNAQLRWQELEELCD